MTTENTALTVQDRAAVALGSSKAETNLIELASKSKSIVAITNKDGRTECHAAAMLAKDARVIIEKAGKAAREDATAFSKAVIAEEKRLVNLIEPEEKRLITLRDEWDCVISREKAAKAEAERLALAKIMTRIANIKNLPMLTAEATSDAVLDDIEKLELLEIDDSFKAYFGEASEAKNTSLQKLREIYAAKVRAESEAIRIKQEQDAQFAKIKAERDELAKLRAEQDLREAEEKKLRDAEFTRLQLIRDKIEAAQIQMAAETAQKAKAEEDQRIKREYAAQCEPDRLATEQNAPTPASLFPEPEIAQVLEQRPACDQNRPVAHPELSLLEAIDAALDSMTKHELLMVQHYCERLIQARKEEA